MRYQVNKIRNCFLLAISVITTMVACNKAPDEILPEIFPPVIPTGLSLGETLANNADDSLYYRLVVHSGQLPVISNNSTSFTLFVANNNAMKAFITAISGGAVPPAAPNSVFSAFITTQIPVSTAAAIVSYNIIPQVVRAASIPSDFPNWKYPSTFNPAPAVSSLLRLPTFPSTANGAWLNNIPLTAVDQEAANGVIHHTAALNAPPSRFLWDRINTDPQLTYLKAAIARADSGTAAPGALAGALQNIGANFTVFAPTDAAFQATLTGAIAQVLIGLGVPPATALAQATALASTPGIFTNPALYPYLTARTIQGIVVYHLMGNGSSLRAFTNNFPTTATSYPTLLNGGIPTHPGVSIAATFGTPFVSAATVKGLGNATASNLIINSSPLIPDPSGTSDQQYLNGVLHKIDQVLLPQ